MEDEQWNKASSDGLFQFEAVGASITGQFTAEQPFTGELGPTKKYLITQADGQTLAIIGTTGINESMSSVPLGATVKITYTGTRALGKGRSFRDFEVLWRNE